MAGAPGDAPPQLAGTAAVPAARSPATPRTPRTPQYVTKAKRTRALQEKRPEAPVTHAFDLIYARILTWVQKTSKKAP
eukprot:gene6038-1523_t